jgi:hypothetical protein
MDSRQRIFLVTQCFWQAETKISTLDRRAKGFLGGLDRTLENSRLLLIGGWVALELGGVARTDRADFNVSQPRWGNCGDLCRSFSS